MPIWLLRRAIEAFLTLAAVLVLTFVLLRIAPGDPAAYIGGPGAPPPVLEGIREQLGLNRPLWDQWITYTSSLLRGDFGQSFSWHQPVNELILARMPATILLVGTSFLIALLVGVSFGVLSARRPRSKGNRALMISSLIAFSTPQFWVGIILLLVFSVWLGVLPSSGLETAGSSFSGFRQLSDVASHLVLPVVALGLADLAIFLRLTRTSMLEVVEQDFIRTARSKGISERRVFFRHALRNALLPLVTFAAMRMRDLLAGAILVETIFGWPGVGRLTVTAINARDYPLITGIVLWAAILVVVSNLIADVLYRWVDPRIGASVGAR